MADATPPPDPPTSPQAVPPPPPPRSPSPPPPPPPPPVAAPPPPPPPPASPPTPGPPAPAPSRPPTPPSPPVSAAPPAAGGPVAPVPTPPAPAPPGAGHDDDLADILRRLSDDDEVLAAPTVGEALTRPTDVERPERAAAAIIESEGGLGFDPEFASYGARAVGLIVDAGILALIQLPAFVLLVAGSGLLAFLGIVLAVVGFVAATALYARDVARSGQSVGNRVAGTRVVDARNGKTVPVATAATRYVMRMLISSILFLGFLVAFTNADRRTFHDQFAGTVVTRPPRETWSIDDDPQAMGL